MTDKIYNQISSKIAIKFNDIDKQLKEAQQNQEAYLQKSLNDINVILADVKERCGKDECKQVTKEQQKEELEVRQLRESLTKL
jgi:hypothetical protein